MSEGKKYDNGKVQWDLVPELAWEEVAKVMTHGASKYEAHNWRKGMRWGRLIAATMRHMTEFRRGREIDPETGLHHLAHAATNLCMLMEYSILGVGDDDRQCVDGPRLSTPPAVEAEPAAPETPVAVDAGETAKLSLKDRLKGIVG